jgi:hypothetical protein
MTQITTKQLSIKARFSGFFTGAMLVLIICSFLGFRYAQTTPSKGDVTFKNCSASTMEYYFVIAASGAKYDFCSTRLHFGQLSAGQIVTHPIDSGKVLEYRFYAGTDCSSSGAKATGTIAYDKATGQTIDVGCK